MVHAARGALLDSVAHHVTLANLSMIAGVGAIGAAAPVVASHLPRRLRPVTGLCLLAVVAIGAWSPGRIDTIGLDRNAVTALWPQTGRTTTVRAGPSMRRSPMPLRAIDGNAWVDLSRYRRTAHGMNVLLVVLESTAASSLAPYGAGEDPMPFLTDLTGRALLFDNAYAAYPESVKGLYATLCGHMPRFGASAEQHAALPCESFPRTLANAGYRTALFHSGRFAYLGMAELLAGTGFQQLEDAGAIGGQVESSFGVEESATVARLLSWIDETDASHPFFATYLPAAGHHPYATVRPGPFPSASDRDRHRNAIHEADEAMQALVEGLRARRLDQRTSIVVVGDHGEAFGEHLGNTGHSLFVYEENVHVPWVIVVPGLTDSTIRIPNITSLVDVPSTILDLVGLTRSDADEGHGLGGKADSMALYFTDYSLSWLGLRDACWTYLYEAQARRSQLFDVCEDPGQTHDLSAAEAARVEAYRQRVEAALLDHAK